MTDGTNAPRMTPKHHKLQGTLGVALPVNARGDGNSVVVILALMVSPSNMTLDSATTGVLCYHGSTEHGGKQLLSCMKFFKRLVTPVMSILALFIFFNMWLQLWAREWPTDRRPGRSADV